MAEKARPENDPKEMRAGKGRKNLELIQEATRDHQHAIFHILSVSLFALFQTDGTAFSAGSLISAIFWVCAGAAGALQAEAVAAERRTDRVEDRRLMADGRGKRKIIKERPSALRSVPPLAGLEERAKGA